MVRDNTSLHAGGKGGGALRRLFAKKLEIGRIGPCHCGSQSLSSALRRQRPTMTSRRGGRVVECTALEMRHTRKGIGGSNPSLSAISGQADRDCGGIAPANGTVSSVFAGNQAASD